MKYYVALGGRDIGLDIVHTQDGTMVKRLHDDDTGASTAVDFAAVHSNIDTGEGLYSIIADGKSYELYVEPNDSGFRVAVWRHRFDVNVMSEREWRLKKVAPRQSAHSGETVVTAPMPGLVKEVLVSVGDTVAMGQRLLVLEAMKMENDIAASAPGRVTKVNVEAGSVVDGGKLLVAIES